MTIAVIQSTASGSRQAWHGQDMLLALASMDLNPQLILTGDGLTLWHKHHDAHDNSRSLHKRYAMLALFDCPAPWVYEDELFARGWNASEFIGAIEVLDRDTWQQRLASLEKVLTY